MRHYCTDITKARHGLTVYATPGPRTHTINQNNQGPDSISTRRPVRFSGTIKFPPGKPSAIPATRQPTDP
jgi:hypothetical protein